MIGLGNVVVYLGNMDAFKKIQNRLSESSDEYQFCQDYLKTYQDELPLYLIISSCTVVVCLGLYIWVEMVKMIPSRFSWYF